ncbi:MAG: leucine--tRNA ligase [Flavobacteriales bacterium]|nr:leucine--tRNA ligase [Bacteroidota bacterium]MCB9241045.1 leucine--tRNA ligase [Flavobacteriales bacterium]
MSEAQYNHRFIEHKWQQIWREKELYKVENGTRDGKPKFYALDMFPYPSGAGLHVGHPLGYIASDIVSRFKRLNGFNVLHPMGYDAFGLPAEQYAIQTGQHPAKTTEDNIRRYRQQLDRIGFSFDWSREVRTCDPDYYKWTQWIFKQLFNHWFNTRSNKAEHIDNLVAIFEHEGNINVQHSGDKADDFIAEEWLEFTPKEREKILQKYRLAFKKETTVNWCEELGTVLANEEVKDGLSERGGYPVIKKKMSQWFLRITAYAPRLLDGLNTIEWNDSLKEMQRNWIGQSTGAAIDFNVEGQTEKLPIFTTRPDTLFGATFMVLAPEHPWAKTFASKDQFKDVQEYIGRSLNRSERDRMSDVKNITGVFTGRYAIHPFTGQQLPIWIADYVLGGYGTGAVMAVPAHDSRDFDFARHFKLPIVQVIKGDEPFPGDASYDAKDGTCINSDFLNGLSVKEAINRALEEVERRKIGKRQTNYRLRDAGFGRQRYWGEPIPILYKHGIPSPLPDSELPLTLPDVTSFKPTGTGESPLAALDTWTDTDHGKRETDTMPGWAGSSWYFLRYMDPDNEQVFASRDAINYWGQVDLYLGGAEHATGHLLYSRFWTKFLYDLGMLPFDEPFKKLVNQGMIQGIIESIYLRKEKIDGEQILKCATLLSEEEKENDFVKIPVLVDFIRDYEKTDAPSYMDLQSLKLFIDWRPEFQNGKFICKNGVWQNGIFEPNGDDYEPVLFTASEIGKMSKSRFNVVNPDDICEEYGADTLRLYEMFLGPLEDAKPWSTSGIDGVYRFLRKFWKLYVDKDGNYLPTDAKPDAANLKTLHTLIGKVQDDIDRMSLNTCVSSFMIAVNELTAQNCSSKEVLDNLIVVLSPFAPHIAEELWERGGHSNSVVEARWPRFQEKYLIENTKNYPISINGKTRTQMEFPVDMDKAEIEKLVLANDSVQKWLEGKAPKKVIIVPGRIINLVI